MSNPDLSSALGVDAIGRSQHRQPASDDAGQDQHAAQRLMGIVIAIPIVLSGHADVLAAPAAFQFGPFVGLVVLAVVAGLLYRAAVRGSRAG